MPLDRNLYNSLLWGAEMECSGESRKRAAEVLAEFFGTNYVHEGTHYDKYSVIDSEGRKWTIMSDASIIPIQKRGNRIVSAPDTHKVEFVSPPLYAKDIPMYQEIIRKLRKAGFMASEGSTGVHVHVCIKDLPPKTIINVINNVYSKQDLLLKALNVNPSMSGRYRYCKKLPTELVENLKKRKPKTLSEIADVWYNTLDDSSSARYSRYPQSRYHIINCTRGLVPDSNYYYGTIEIRAFNTPKLLHAGVLRSYIEFSLLLITRAATQSRSSYKKTEVLPNESSCYKFRCWLLHLSAIGPEFATLRHHLLDNFGNQSKAWRRGDRTSS